MGARNHEKAAMRSVLVEEAQDGVEDAMGGKARETARLKIQEGMHEAPGRCLATAVTSTAAFREEIVEWGLVQSRDLS